MVNVECFIVFCSSRLGRVLVISIRQFAKVYPPICESLSADLRRSIRRFAKVYLPICESISADLRKPIRRFAKVYPPICESLSANLRKPIRRFAKVYLPICKKRCKVISFSPYNDAVATHFNFASDRTRCLLAFYNNCVITQFPQHLKSVTSTLLPHRSPLPSPFLSSRLLIPFVSSPYPFRPIYLPSLHLTSLSQRHQKQNILLPSIRGGEEQPIGLRGGGASFPPSLSLFITLLTLLHRK